MATLILPATVSSESTVDPAPLASRTLASKLVEEVPSPAVTVGPFEERVFTILT